MELVLLPNGDIVEKGVREKGFSDYICQMPYSSESEAKEMPESVKHGKLIVKAVNNYKPLLEACKKVLNHFDLNDSDILESNSFIINTLDKAIKNAEEN